MLQHSEYSTLRHKAYEAVTNRKIFTVYGRDANEIRKALLHRGWVEKLPPDHLMSKLNFKLTDASRETTVLSDFLQCYAPNFLWAGKLMNEPFKKRSSGYDFLVKNRLKRPNNINSKYKLSKNEDTIVSKLKVVVKDWSSKAGLCTSLKDTSWYYIEGVAEVYAPRTYNNTDRCDIVEFVNDYCLTACTSLLRWILNNLLNSEPIFRSTGNVSVSVLVFALNRCKEYLNKKKNKDIDEYKCRVISSGQWNSFITKQESLITGKDVFKMDKERNIPLLVLYAHHLLNEILKYRPDLKCDGCHNFWIIKPSRLSMGAGIRLSSNLNEILKILTRTTKNYVVQKYIETPLLIYNTKFDIRQYYLITSTYPLEIWTYKDCFLKFCSQNFTLKSYHESVHLTNQAIQRHYKNNPDRNPGLPIKNICGLDSFKNYLKFIKEENIWDKIIYPGIKKTIIGTMLTSQECFSYEKNRFGLYGCDFIIDNEFRPWLIEINNFPDLGPSYSAKLCDKVLIDIVKVVIDHAKNPKSLTGEFECVYRQPTTPLEITQDIEQTLQITGTALRIHSQYERLLDKGTLVCNECNSNYIYTNEIKESDSIALLSFNLDKKRDAFISHTETREQSETDYNNYLDLSTDNELRAHFTATEQNALAKSVKINNRIHITPNEMSVPNNGKQLNENTDKNNYTFKIDMQFNSLTDLEEFWTCMNAYNKPHMTHTEPYAAIKVNSQHLDLSPYKHIGPYMKQEAIVKTKSDIHVDFNPNLEISVYMTNSKSKSLAEPHDDVDLNLNSDKEISLYEIHSKSYTETELHNDDHCNFSPDKKLSAFMIHTKAEEENDKYFYLIPEDDKESGLYNKVQRDSYASPEPNKVSYPNMETFAYELRTEPHTNLDANNDNYLGYNPHMDTYKTHIEPNAIVALDNYEYLDMSTDKERCSHLIYKETTTIVKQHNNDISDVNPESNKRCTDMVHNEPNAIVKLNEEDNLPLNLEAEKFSYVTYSEPNYTTYLTYVMTAPGNNNYLDFNSDEETCAYMRHTKVNTIAELNNDIHFNLNPDNEICTFITHKDTNAIKEMGSASDLDLNPTNKEACASMKQTELLELTESSKFYLTSSMAHRLALRVMKHMKTRHEFPIGPI